MKEQKQQKNVIFSFTPTIFIYSLSLLLLLIIKYKNMRMMMMIRHHHTNNNINSPFLMCSNICSDFFMQPFRPLSCVGGRWRVLLPVTGGAAAWLVSYQNRSLITVEQGRGQWLLPAPRTLLCYPSTFIFMYSVSVLPKTNPYSAGIISNSSRTRSTKGRHMDREWRRRGEREGA